jgi:hypothetical protein
MAKNYCLDCKVKILPKGTFMVNNQLWASYGAGKSFLCMTCFESRLKRKLEKSDLIPCMINEEVNPITKQLLFS